MTAPDPQERFGYREVLHEEFPDGTFIRVEHIFEAGGDRSGEVALVTGDRGATVPVLLTPENARRVASALVSAGEHVDIAEWARELARPGREGA